MKYLYFFNVISFIFGCTACCTSYCAECQDCHFIEVELVDEITGEDLTPNIETQSFSIDGFVNDVKMDRHFDEDHFYIDISIAQKDKMTDVINLYYQDELVETLNTTYQLNGDAACCKIRSVLVQNIETTNGSTISDITTDDYADFKVTLLISQ